MGQRRTSEDVRFCRTRLRRMSSLRPRKRAKRTSARACRAPRRVRALARGGFWLPCARRGLGGYPRDGFLSFFHGPGYVGHQLFQIVLGVFKLRRLCVHFHFPIRRPPREKGARPQYSGPKCTVSKDLAARTVLAKDHPWRHGAAIKRSSVVALWRLGSPSGFRYRHYVGDVASWHESCRSRHCTITADVGVQRTCRGRRRTAESDPNVWSGRAVQEASSTWLMRSCINVSGLCLERVCAPGHHGYQRACDLISG
jgi:hypothetical protein